MDITDGPLDLDPADPSNTKGQSPVLDLTVDADRADYHRLLLFKVYIGDRGIRAYLTRAIAQDVYGTSDKTIAYHGDDAGDVFAAAYRDIADAETEVTTRDVLAAAGSLIGSFFDGWVGEMPAETDDDEADEATDADVPNVYDLRGISDAAASLKLLVDYAERLPRYIFPREALPTREFVDRCLKIFHALKAAAVREELEDSSGLDHSADVRPSTAGTPALPQNRNGE